MEPAQHAAIALAMPTEAPYRLSSGCPQTYPKTWVTTSCRTGCRGVVLELEPRPPALLSARRRLIIGREYKIEFGGMEFRKRLTSFFRRQQRCRLNALAQPGVAFGEGNRRHIQSEKPPSRHAALHRRRHIA